MAQNVPQKYNNQPLPEIKQAVVDNVFRRINELTKEGQVELPDNYSAGNAMNSAWLQLLDKKDKNGVSVLQACSQQTIANALFSMVIQGLSPEKSQGYFIAYAKNLIWQKSYNGNKALAMRANPSIVDVVAEVVYKDDSFAYSIDRGKKTITQHEQSLANVNKDNIVAAYCVVLGADDKILSTVIMTMEEIKAAWRMSRTPNVNDKGVIKKGSTHDKFTADMCKKTATSKACRPIINASDDSYLKKAIEIAETGVAEIESQIEYDESANQEQLDFEETIDAQLEEVGGAAEVESENGEGPAEAESEESEGPAAAEVIENEASGSTGTYAPEEVGGAAEAGGENGAPGSTGTYTPSFLQ